MKYRAGSDPIEYHENPRWAYDAEIKRIIKHRVRAAQGKATDDDEPVMKRPLERCERIYVDLQVSAKLGKPLAADVFVKALNKVRTRVSAPLITSPTQDFITAWSQPEAARLWARWNVPGADTPAFQGTKAVMAWLGGGRLTSHMKAAHDSLIHNVFLLDHFEELARLTPAGRLRGADASALVVRDYTTCTRHDEKLARALIPIAHRTLVEIAQAAALLCPHLPLFTWAACDGNMIPAWTPQKSAKRKGVLIPEIEARYRSRTPEAGYRAYGYTTEGQETESQAKEGKRKLRSSKKEVRGYIETLLGSLTSPFTLGLTLDDAKAVTEPWELRPILPPIYEIWPDFPLEVIVGDKLYDVEEHHRWLEVHYGVHLCAVRKPSLAATGGRQITEKQYAGVACFTGEGLAFCRKHGDPDDPTTALLFERFEAPSRKEMKPGDPHHPGLFRTRLRCDDPVDPCGRLNMPTRFRWSALPALPHHPHGRPGLYALRLALEHQRNMAESRFASQELSFKLGLHGAARTRLFSKDVYEALILLSQITLGLMTLASMRQHLGIKASTSDVVVLEAMAA
jgi:hypothetical protein